MGRERCNCKVESSNWKAGDEALVLPNSEDDIFETPAVLQKILYGNDQMTVKLVSLPIPRTRTCPGGHESNKCYNSPFKLSSTFYPLVTLFYLSWILSCNFISVSCAPVNRRPYISTSSVQHYLLKFGYLPQSGFEIRDQVTDDRMRDAIRELQAFANLTVTGDVDTETRLLIQRPRCGVPDILSGQFLSSNQNQNRSHRHRRFIIQGQKWPTTSLTWSVKRASPAHEENDIIRELDRAISVWSKSTKLRFNRLAKDQADEADIRIVFSKGYHDDGYPFDGKGSILAHAFFPGAGQGGDAHFDDDEVWIINGKSQAGEGTRLFAVAAHEFGHSLGLSHSDVEGALMYPWYQNFDYDLRLSRDDELGIQRIYGSESKWAPNPYKPGNGQPAKPVSPPTTTPTRGKTYHPTNGRPITCDSSYDAISLIRDELFIFKGRYFWRVNSTPNDNRLLKGYPSLITNMWQKLPSNLTHVDAVYEYNEVEIVFFIGRYYWRFRGTELLHGYPKPLTSMNISPDVDKIDGAMIWGHNTKTYLFSGSQYWRLQDNDRDVFRVEPDYPRDMYVWKGIPYNIDSVLKWKDGNSYFFKGKVFWKFNDKHMRVESETPTLSAPFWMGCTSTPIIPTEKNPISPTSGTTSSGIYLTFAEPSRITTFVFCIASSMLSLTFTKTRLFHPFW